MYADSIFDPLLKWIQGTKPLTNLFCIPELATRAVEPSAVARAGAEGKGEDVNLYRQINTNLRFPQASN